MRTAESKINDYWEGFVEKVEFGVREFADYFAPLFKASISFCAASVKVAIYVGKILPDQSKEKRPAKKEDSAKEPEHNVPFQGYRA